tara:strand:- start:694 stop:963 length:270 start_codon:yes stop_codon:yes gene_type:complete
MEYVLGPVLALMLSMKFTDWKADQQNKKVKEFQSLIESTSADIELLQTAYDRIESRHKEIDQELLKKVMTTITPIAKAVVKLNTEIGIR